MVDPAARTGNAPPPDERTSRPMASCLIMFVVLLIVVGIGSVLLYLMQGRAG